MRPTNWHRLALRLLLFTFLQCLLLARPAQAYVDPGSGSFILQLLAAGLFSALFSAKLFFSRIKGFFLGLRSRKKPSAGDDGSPRSP